MRKIHTEADAGDLAETMSNHAARGDGPGHAVTDRGRQLVREYVAQIDAPAREFASAKRVLVEVGYYCPQENETVDSDAVRDVGTTLAAIRDGETSNLFFSGVSVEAWSDSTPTTWIIEVSE